MTQDCCPSCRLRFTRAAAAHLGACPRCGEPLQSIPSAEGMIGFRLVSPDEFGDALPEAVAIAMPWRAPDVEPS